MNELHRGPTVGRRIDRWQADMVAKKKKGPATLLGFLNVTDAGGASDRNARANCQGPYP